MSGTGSLSLALLAALAAACGGRDAGGGGPDSPAAASPAVSPSSTTAAAPADSAGPRPGADCVSAGAWQPCSVEKRLTDAGFVPQKQETPARGLFPVDGIEYSLGPAKLYVYVFPSATERAAAVAAIDTVAIARRGAPAAWGGPAWLITSNNLVAVLVSDNARLVERVQLALTAGLPSASD